MRHTDTHHPVSADFIPEAPGSSQADHDSPAPAGAFPGSHHHALPVPIFYQDADGRFRYGNKAFEEFTGLASSQLAGKHARELLPPEAAALNQSMDAVLLQNGGQQTYEALFPYADGSLRPVQIQKVLCLDAAGQPSGLAGILLDLSAHKQLEAVMRRQNEYLEMLHETALELMDRRGLHSILTAIVERSSRLLGTPHAYIYLTDPDQDDLELKVGLGIHTARIGQRRRRGEGVSGTVWKHGTHLVLRDYTRWEQRDAEAALDSCRSVIALPLRIADKIIGVFGLDFCDEYHDFTPDETEWLKKMADLAALAIDNALLYERSQNELAQRHLAQADLKRSHSMLKASQEAVIDGILIVSEERQIMDYNRRFLGIFPVPDDILASGDDNQCFACALTHVLNPDDFRASTEAIFAQRELCSYDVIHLRDGRVVERYSGPIFSADGDYYGRLWNFRDITARIQTEAALSDVESRYRLAINLTSEGFWMLDRDLRFVDINDALCRILGVSRQSALGKTPYDFIQPQSQDIAKVQEQHFRSGNTDNRNYELMLRAADGREVFVKVHGTTVMDSNHQPQYAFAFISDITEMKQTEEALRRSEANNQAIMRALPDSIFRLSREGVFLDHTGGTSQSLFLPAEQFIGKKAMDVLPPHLALETHRRIHKTLFSGEMQIYEYTLSLDQKVRHFEARMVVCAENEVLAIVRDITERRVIETQLKFLSLHDALTGLYNRVFFEQEMRRLAERNAHAVGIIVCDVDGLKLVNDTLGHDSGDIVLLSAASVLKKSLPADTVIARIGGDEFAILLTSCTRPLLEEACRLIRANAEQYNNLMPGIHLSLSLGFALATAPRLNTAELFREADNNMYREKLHQSQSSRSALVQTLIRALEARDFITDGHGDRMQYLVENLSKAIGLPESKLGDMRLLARFHDLGKVGIPDRILFKPAPLNPDEYAEMKRHAEIGYRIARSTPDLAPIADCILKHHEWYNGQGYPLGLQGEEIPLECRILSIADAYDAMTSDRPYRKALPRRDALTELARLSGTQFDPVLTDAFVRLLSEEDGTEVIPPAADSDASEEK